MAIYSTSIQPSIRSAISAILLFDIFKRFKWQIIPWDSLWQIFFKHLIIPSAFSILIIGGKSKKKKGSKGGQRAKGRDNCQRAASNVLQMDLNYLTRNGNPFGFFFPPILFTFIFSNPSRFNALQRDYVGGSLASYYLLNFN